MFIFNRLNFERLKNIKYYAMRSMNTSEYPKTPHYKLQTMNDITNCQIVMRTPCFCDRTQNEM